MPKSGLNVALKGLDDIFSTEESRQEEQREQVQQIPVSELFPFKNHPFKVLDDDSMTRTVESISQFGVLAPLIARPRPEGGYEIISGHRRKHAAELANLDTVPVIVRNMEDDAATILMVDSNLQREHNLTGPVILVRTNMDGEVISLTIDEVYLFQKYLASHSITLMADDQKLPCICME